jgi:hypothetical protein
MNEIIYVGKELTKLQTIKRKCKRPGERVAHACNPSCSGGRDQEDHGSKPAWQITCETLFAHHTHKKKSRKERAGGVVEKGLSSSPSTVKGRKEGRKEKEEEEEEGKEWIQPEHDKEDNYLKNYIMT